MNILITGASGFVGKALVSELSKKRYRLFLVTRDRNFSSPKGKIYRGDLESRDFCKTILKGIDCVYYLAAAKKNIAFHTSQPYEILRGNTVPLFSFLDAVKSRPVKKIIFLGSTIVDYVDSKVQEIDGYAFGKFVNELVLKVFQKQIPKTDIILLRSAAVYGSGDNFDPKTANLIPALIHRIDKSSERVEVWGRGKRRLQFIYIDDLIKNLAVCISAKVTQMPIIGNPETKSVDDIVKIIIRHFGKDIKIFHNTSQPDKPTSLVQFRNLVKPKVNLEEGLRRTIEYYRRA